MYWLLLELELVAAFSLRPSNATSSSGKSLLVPSPFAIKMALLDCLITQRAIEDGKKHFAAIRDLEIFIQLPKAIAVSSLTRRIQRPEGSDWVPSVIFQEYCLYGGSWALAFGYPSLEPVTILAEISWGLSYLGQRGGFVQVLDQATIFSQPSSEFQNLRAELNPNLPSFGMVQRLDDMKPEISFDDVSRYSQNGSTKIQSRRQYDLSLPYRLTNRGSNSRLYELEA